MPSRGIAVVNESARRLNAAEAAVRLGTAQGLYDPRHERDACGVGFIANLKAKKSHQIIADGLTMLVNLTHRGAVGADPLQGDGAGMLTQIPHDLLTAEMKAIGVNLPEPGHYAVGQLFMPREPVLRRYCEEVIAKAIHDEGQTCLGWRDVPVSNTHLSAATTSTEPFHRQVSSAVARA